MPAGISRKLLERFRDVCEWQRCSNPLHTDLGTRPIASFQMMNSDTDTSVAAKLTQARRAASGAIIARENGDPEAAWELEEKARRLRDEAEAMDVGHIDAAWDEVAT
jgi:hypothetical protein